MKLLPFENITYTTELSTEEIIQNLRENIEPTKLFRIKGFFKKKDYKPYEGNIDGKLFSITRIIRYRNLFNPIIKGEIKQDFTGVRIKVKMGLSIFAWVVLSIWFLLLGLIFLVILSDYLTNQLSNNKIIYICFGILIFGYLNTIPWFKYESKKSKNYFTKLFNAEIQAR